MARSRNWSRREFLGATAGALTWSASAGAYVLRQDGKPAPKPAKLKVAAVVTEFSYRSHAHVILENFLEPYYFNGQIVESGMDVVSLFMDQSPRREMGRETAKQYGFNVYPTIAEALTLGGKELAVDAVLSIGEHGRYPSTERRQVMYPRKRFFDEIVAVFRNSGRSVPVFNDKHLSYRWDWALEMVETARELKFPLMAGSSVPLAQRRPPLELPDGAEIEEAVSIHGGNLEGYDFHALEVLQSMVEARRGGETGVSAVQFLENEEIWKAADEGRFSLALADAAIRAELGDKVKSFREFAESPENRGSRTHAFVIQYRDGLRGVLLRVGGSATRWDFACRLKGEAQPRATSYNVGPWNNRNLFKALSHAIQDHFRNGRAPYTVERTLMTTGILAAAMDSRFEGHKRLETPQLHFSYEPRDFRAMREMGDSWKIVTENTPEPKGIDSARPRPEVKP